MGFCGSVVDGRFQSEGWPCWAKPRLQPRFRSARSSRGLETPIYIRTPYWILFLAHHHRQITFRSWKELKHIDWYVVCLGKNTRITTKFLSQSKTTDSGVQEITVLARTWHQNIVSTQWRHFDVSFNLFHVVFTGRFGWFQQNDGLSTFVNTFYLNFRRTICSV